MARKDVVKYYLEQQAIYFELLQNIEDIEPDIKEGKVSEDVVEQLKKELLVNKENYERTAYIMFLLNKPNRKSKQAKEERMNAIYYDYLNGSSKEAVLDESKDALERFKKLVKECKKNEH